MPFAEIIYQPGKVARIVLNRPALKNAQSWRLREEMDTAFAAAMADAQCGAVVLSGAERNFSAGHDIGSQEDRDYRKSIGRASTDSHGAYRDMRYINVENTLRWRQLPKPTIAMVEGYCIFGGWMIAAGMDVIFAADDALFLPGVVQYFSVPWDLGARKAKEILLEHRFMTARECMAAGFVNRVYGADELEAQTLAYAGRVADNYLSNPAWVETAKFGINHMQDAQGFTAEIEAGYEHFARMQLPLRGGERSTPAQGGFARTHMAKAHYAAEQAWLAENGLQTGPKE